MANAVTGLEKMEAQTREHVMRLIDSKTEDIARRDHLDLKKPADLVKAYSTVCTEDPGLYDLYRRVSSVPVGSTLLND